MKSKKVVYLTLILAFVVLVYVGCGKEKEPIGGSVVDPLETQSEYVKGAISKIMEKMNWDINAVVAKRIRTRRSLAVHILENHTALMAHFMSENWDRLPTKQFPGQELFTFRAGEKVRSFEAPNIFWQEIYAALECDSAKATLELEANVNDILLKDLDDPIWDCQARVDFEFRVVCREENEAGEDKLTEKLKGQVRFLLCHRDPCPWYVDESCPIF